MTLNGWVQILLFALIVFAITKPLGIYMFRVFEGDRQPLPRFFGPIERWIYKLCGVDPKEQQDWKQYTLALLVFSAVTLLVTYAHRTIAAHPAAKPAESSGRFRRTLRSTLLRASPPIRTGRPTAASRR